MITFITQASRITTACSVAACSRQGSGKSMWFPVGSNLNDLVGKREWNSVFSQTHEHFGYSWTFGYFILVAGGVWVGSGRGLLFSSLRLLHRLSPYAIKSCPWEKVSQSIQLMLYLVIFSKCYLFLLFDTSQPVVGNTEWSMIFKCETWRVSWRSVLNLTFKDKWAIDTQKARGCQWGGWLNLEAKGKMF